MRAFNKFLVAFYTLIFMLLGLVLVFISLHLIKWVNLSLVFACILEVPNLWMILLLTGIALMIVSFYLAKLAYGNFQREKTIAFKNPEGPVIISLSAIEDFIKRITADISEVKEIRPDIIAARKDIIDVSTRIVLWSDTNIPEVTEKVQLLIKNRIQEMLNIEQQIIVKVHVTKIVQREPTKDTPREQAQFPYLR